MAPSARKTGRCPGPPTRTGSCGRAVRRLLRLPRCPMTSRSQRPWRQRAVSPGGAMHSFSVVPAPMNASWLSRRSSVYPRRAASTATRHALGRVAAGPPSHTAAPHRCRIRVHLPIHVDREAASGVDRAPDSHGAAAACVHVYGRSDARADAVRCTVRMRCGSTGGRIRRRTRCPLPTRWLGPIRGCGSSRSRSVGVWQIGRAHV